LATVHDMTGAGLD